MIGEYCTLPFSALFTSDNNDRGLTPDDLHFLHAQLNPQERVGRGAFEFLWDGWLGPVLKPFTDKNFAKLWNTGYVEKNSSVALV